MFAEDLGLYWYNWCFCGSLCFLRVFVFAGGPGAC